MKEIVDRNFGQLTETSILGRDARLMFDVPMALPEDVLIRYVNRLRQAPRTPREFAALRTRVDGHCPDGNGRAIDRHLHELLRPVELLLRIGGLEWLTFMPVDFSFAKRMTRIRNSLASIRFPADHAKIKIVDEGTWSMGRRVHDVLEELRVHALYSMKRGDRPFQTIERSSVRGIATS